MLEPKKLCSNRLGPTIEPNGFASKGSLKELEPPKKLGIRGGMKPPKPLKGSPEPKRPPLPPHPLCIFH
jgi:hypothetical protein